MTKLTIILLAALAVVSAALPAAAATRGLFDLIGYSPDNRYFAFEEYGVEDGSGLSFSTISIIDLSTDTFVKGAPFAAVAPEVDGTETVADVRLDARKAASAALKRYNVSSAGHVLVMLADGVANADGKSMQWSTPNCCAPGSTEDGVFKLGLATFDMKRTDECDGIVDAPPMGFALTLTLPDGTSSEVHRDIAAPKSRGCTNDYRLYAVVAPLEEKGAEVAIVGSYPFGFEGDDRKFLAVPLGDLY